MRPVETAVTKTKYVHPQYDGETKLNLMCEQLVDKTDHGIILGNRSFWKPNDEELADLKDGGVVELVLWGERLPPVSVAGISMLQAAEPFVE